MSCITTHSKIEEILYCHREELGKDFEMYRNHVYRVFNFAHLFPRKQTILSTEILAIAAAFHDIGIWTHRTFDYLEPSVELAKTYCITEGFGSEIADIVATIIEQHHTIVSVPDTVLALIFRQADLCDLMMGLIHEPINIKSIKELWACFPNRGFHWKLVKLFFKNLLICPWRPLPMFKL
ncbi:MAG: hypothetical protein RIS47_2352 [Bacteroidota bacterium]